MTNPREPAVRPTEAASPQGKQGVFDIPSTSKYFNISSGNKEKYTINYCKCWSCDSVKDFAIEYYSNSTILRDNDKSVHIPKVVD